MMRRILPGLLAVALVAGPVGAVVLASLLDAVAGNARAARALRADVVITRGDARTTAVLLLWRDVLYLETAGFRALVRGDKAVVVRGGHAVRAPVRTLIPGTDLLLEELPFAGVPLRYPQIQDEGPGEVVVSGAPEGPSLYVLIARTIEPERAIVVSTKYYKDDIAVLFKMRQDRAFTRVDGRWRPGEIEVEDFSEHSTTRLALAWKLAPDLPRAVFTPRGLRGPSGLTLPAAP